MNITTWLFLATLTGTSTSQVTGNTEATHQTSHPKPETAALHYIKKVAKGTITLQNDTALSPHCALERRMRILEQLKFLRKTEFTDGDSFSLEAQKIKGDFAAVLLRSENSRTPLTTRIYSVAVVRKNEAWLPAPLLGSFANTNYGYDPEVEKSVRSLERWMAREKIIRQSDARNTAKKEFISSIEKQVTLAKLDSLTPKQAVLNFISQCRKQNLLGLLASMGATSNDLKQPLELLISRVSQGLGIKNPTNEWSLVTNPSVLVQIMKVNPKTKEVAVGFWNPLSKTNAHILYFPFFHSAGNTFLRLPHLLKIASLPENERWRQRWQQHHADEEELKSSLPSTLLKNHPSSAFPKDQQQQMVDAFLHALKTSSFSECLPLLPRKGDYFKEPNNQEQSLIDLSKLWSVLSRLEKKAHTALPLIENNNLALLPLQFANPHRPGEFKTVEVWFILESETWHLIPVESLDRYANKELKAAKQSLRKSLRSLAKGQKEQFSRSLMKQVTTLTPPLQLKAPDDKAAKKTLTEYRTFLRTNAPPSALAVCAILDDTNHTQTLKTFNYAIRGATDHTNTDEVLGINRAGHWTGISLRTESKTSHEYDYPLYLLVNTDQGPKVVLDIDLRYATNMGRTLLNNRNWSKLKKLLPKDSLDDVKSIFLSHEKLSTADVKASEIIKD